MARIEEVTREMLENSIDHTWLDDQLMPKSWKCPHCGKRNTTSRYADEILIENFKYIEHCGCGVVHCWELRLSDDFKRKVVNMLLGDERNDT